VTESPLPPRDLQHAAPVDPVQPAPHHFLMQAPVPVMDVDGFKVTTLGLIAFGVASVLLAIFYADLQRAGNGWWLGVSVSGFALGLVGLAYCRYRRARRRAGRWDRD